MTAEVFPETAYAAFCEECGWAGEATLDTGDAKREAAWHNVRCAGGEEQDDERDERQRFQDQMDDIVHRAYENMRKGLIS